MLAPAIFLASGRFAALGLGLVQLWIIAQLPGETGGVIFPHAGILMALAVFIDLGTGQALLRYCSTDATPGPADQSPFSLSPDNQAMVRAATFFRLRLGFFAWVIHTGIIFAFGDHLDPLIFLASCQLPFYALGTAQTAFLLRAIPAPMIRIRMTGVTLSLLGTAILWFSGVLRPGAYLLVQALGVMVHHILLWRIAGITLRGERATLATILPQSIMLGLGTFVRMLYYHGDTVLVRILFSKPECQIYAIAYRAFSIATLLPNAMGEFLLGHLTKKEKEGARGKERGIRLLSMYMFLLGLIPLVVGFFLAGPVLGFVFGGKYEAAGPALRMLLLAALVVHPASVQITAALAAGRLLAILLLSIGGLGMIVTLCFLLVPTHGAYGAAIATLGTELTVLVGAIIIVHRRLVVAEKGKAT